MEHISSIVYSVLAKTIEGYLSRTELDKIKHFYTHTLKPALIVGEESDLDPNLLSKYLSEINEEKSNLVAKLIKEYFS